MSSRPPKSIAEELGQFSAGVSYSMLPKEAVEFAKALILKTVAGTVAGSAGPNAQKVAGLIQERKLPEEVGAIGCGFRTSLWEGVLLNAFCGHASELEDVGFSTGGISWDITVIPLMLPLGERLHLSGKALIEAVVAGLEVHCRTSLPFDVLHLGMSFPPTSAMGCAVAAAKAYGLNPEQITAAMGFTLSGPPLSEAALATDAHFVESSLQAMQGLIGADMARIGLTSNPDLKSFEGMLAKDAVFEDFTAGLSEHWHFQEMWMKKYPNCFSIHRQLDALFEILRDNRLTYEDIERVEVHTGPDEAWCDRPDPKTAGDLQFSFQHSLGVAMLNGELTLEDFLPDSAHNPELANARRKVDVNIENSADETVGYMSAPTTVTVKVKDGKSYSKQRMSVIGSTEEPLSHAQLSDLYRRYCKNGLSPANIENTMEMLWELENLSDVSELMEILTFPQ